MALYACPSTFPVAPASMHFWANTKDCSKLFSFISQMLIPQSVLGLLRLYLLESLSSSRLSEYLFCYSNSYPFFKCNFALFLLSSVLNFSNSMAFFMSRNINFISSFVLPISSYSSYRNQPFMNMAICCPLTLSQKVGSCSWSMSVKVSLVTLSSRLFISSSCFFTMESRVSLITCALFFTDSKCWPWFPVWATSLIFWIIRSQGMNLVYPLWVCSTTALLRLHSPSQRKGDVSWQPGWTQTLVTGWSQRKHTGGFILGWELLLQSQSYSDVFQWYKRIVDTCCS